MLVTTTAIVLRSQKYGDTSKIVTLYTREFGKVSVVAKGAREVKSKFGGALESFAKVKAVFYKTPEPGLYLLGKSELIDSNARILDSLEKLECAVEAIEIILRAMHDEEENPQMFDLLSEVLGSFSILKIDSGARLVLFAFYLRFAKLSGFSIDLDGFHHLRAANPASLSRARFAFHLTTGEIEEIPSGPDSAWAVERDAILLGAEELVSLVKLDACSIASAGGLTLSAQAINRLRGLFSGYFAEHLTNITSRTMKSARVFSSMNRTSNP